MGCKPAQRHQLTSDTLIGTYVYHSEDKAEQHSPDRLTLKPDGTYTVVHISSDLPGPVEQGKWKLIEGAKPTVLLDHAGYPVEISEKGVRLLIDLDLGHWYEKTG